MSTSQSDIKVADLLGAIRDHLEEHKLPEPYGVQVRSRAVGGNAPVSVHLAEQSLPAVAGVLATWSDTLREVSLSVWRPPSGDAVHVQVSGRFVGGVLVEVWAGVNDPPLLSELFPSERRTLRLGLLRAWIAIRTEDEDASSAREGGTA